VEQAIYHGVPTICLTFWGDQPYNAARMHYRGYGIDLGRMKTVTTDRLVGAVGDVINNRSYADNVRAASAIFRSRPETPRQRAVCHLVGPLTLKACRVDKSVSSIT
jgi:glucuronosyltransferase